MLRNVAAAQSQLLTPDEYFADFWPYFRGLERVFWKLETRQSYREPDEPSWLALDAGDWGEAIRLIDERRREIQRPLREAGEFAMRRVRLVERPFSRYLQWELYYIRLRALAGEHIRVLEADRLPALGFPGPLPELVVLDSTVMYEVLYSEDGTLTGARKILDRSLIESCGDDMEKLFGQGVELIPYMAAERDVLPPPLRHSTAF